MQALRVRKTQLSVLGEGEIRRLRDSRDGSLRRPTDERLSHSRAERDGRRQIEEDGRGWMRMISG
jgi:hypothetical protein